MVSWDESALRIHFSRDPSGRIASISASISSGKRSNTEAITDVHDDISRGLSLISEVRPFSTQIRRGVSTYFLLTTLGIPPVGSSWLCRFCCSHNE